MASKVRGRLAIAMGALIVIGGPGGYYWATSREAKKQVSLGWGKLATCLVGAPLKEGEKPSDRFHRIELVAASAPRDAAERNVGTKQWPDRCTTEAELLYGRLLEAGYADVGDRAKKAGVRMHERTFAYWVDELTTPMSLPSSESHRAALDTLWEEAKKEGIVARYDGGAEVYPPPPIPAAEPLTIEALVKKNPLVKSIDGIAFGQFEDGLPMLVQRSADEPPLWCLVGEKEASCKKSGIAQGVAARLVGAAEGARSPLVYADGHVVRAETGERITDAVVSWNAAPWVAADGTATVLTADPKDPGASFLVRQAPGKPASKPKRIPDELEHPKVYGGWLVASSNRASGLRVVVAPINESGGLGAVQDLGPGPAASMCRTSEAMFLTAASALYVFAGGAWSKPIPTSVRGRLTCRGQEATQTTIDGEQVVQERCTASGCKKDSVFKREIWREGKVDSAFVSDLDGRLLVAWYDRKEVPLIKIAPINEIKNALPIALVDPFIKGEGVSDTPVDAPSRIFAGNRFALVLFAPPAGAFVVRVMPDGSFSFVEPAGDR